MQWLGSAAALLIMALVCASEFKPDAEPNAVPAAPQAVAGDAPDAHLHTRAAPDEGAVHYVGVVAGAQHIGRQ